MLMLAIFFKCLHEAVPVQTAALEGSSPTLMPSGPDPNRTMLCQGSEAYGERKVELI